MLVDIDGGIHVYLAGRVRRKLMTRKELHETEVNARTRTPEKTTDCAAVKGTEPSRGGPMLFDFTEPERNTMRRALELYVSELREEIVKTEKHEWLQALREEKAILKGVIEQLSV